MRLYELAKKYRESSSACRARVSVLKRELGIRRMGETEKIRLRRRIAVLNEMARDASATARYLESYYEKENRI